MMLLWFYLLIKTEINESNNQTKKAFTPSGWIIYEYRNPHRVLFDTPLLN